MSHALVSDLFVLLLQVFLDLLDDHLDIVQLLIIDLCQLQVDVVLIFALEDIAFVHLVDALQDFISDIELVAVF